MKREKDKYSLQSKKKKNFIIKFIQLICIMLMIFSSIKIYKWIKENNENRNALSKLQNVISKDDMDKEIEFSELQSINSDIVAWIKINNTNVDYPVV